MAVPSQLEDAAPDAGDTAFLEQSHLTYVVPYKTGVDIKEEIEDAIAQKKPLEDIETRSWLFFGMHSRNPLLPESSRVSQYSFIDAR